MAAYALRRLCLIVPTLLVILTLNFFLVQLAPGGPVEQYMAQLEGDGDLFMERVGSGGASSLPESGAAAATYTGSRGLSPDTVQAIREMYGFDKPLLTRYWEMVTSFVRFDFGHSLFKAESVVGLLKNALPVSVSLGLWSTLIIYAVSIPLGIARARRRGSAFDTGSGMAVVVASTIPGFLFAVLLIVLFAGGSYFKLFPLRGLSTIGADAWPLWRQVLDYFHHLALPLLAMTIGGFAGLTLLTRNSFLDELGKQYVETARAKGLGEKAVLYRHVFRNAMLLIISGLPAMFVRLFFTGALLIETIFSLNGLGLLGFEAAMQRDYPVMFATLYIFTLMGMLTSLLSDLTLRLVDPRIDFSGRRRV